MAEANKSAKEEDIQDSPYKKVLSRKRVFLINSLSGVREILDRLMRDEMIDELTYRDIRDTLNNKTTSDAIRVLIDDVLTASKRNYDTFLDILEEEKLHEVKEELLKEEQLIIETGLCCIIDKIKEIQLEDNSAQHHDICILFEDEDYEIAREVKMFLERLTQPNASQIRILLHDDVLFLCESNTSKLEKIASLTTMQFYIVPRYESKDKQLKWARDSLIMKGIKDGKFTVHKVLTEKDSKNSSEVALSNLQEIKWYYCHKSFFIKKMENFIDCLIKDRPE